MPHLLECSGSSEFQKKALAGCTKYSTQSKPEAKCQNITLMNYLDKKHEYF
jgi:hypothetical protein